MFGFRLFPFNFFPLFWAKFLLAYYVSRKLSYDILRCKYKRQACFTNPIKKFKCCISICLFCFSYTMGLNFAIKYIQSNRMLERKLIPAQFNELSIQLWFAVQTRMFERNLIQAQFDEFSFNLQYKPFNIWKNRR